VGPRTGGQGLPTLATTPPAVRQNRRERLPRSAPTPGFRATLLRHLRPLAQIGYGLDIETQEELRLLTELGCDQVQGFLLAKPMPRDDLTNVLQHGNGRLIRPVGSDQNARI
jgi:hypothetical protein